MKNDSVLNDMNILLTSHDYDFLYELMNIDF